jgi:hypothetical protein
MVSGKYIYTVQQKGMFYLRLLVVQFVIERYSNIYK